MKSWEHPGNEQCTEEEAKSISNMLSHDDIHQVEKAVLFRRMVIAWHAAHLTCAVRTHIPRTITRVTQTTHTRNHANTCMQTYQLASSYIRRNFAIIPNMHDDSELTQGRVRPGASALDARQHAPSASRCRQSSRIIS